MYIYNTKVNVFSVGFDIGLNLNRKTNNPIFRNKEIVIKQLNQLRANYFKDSERLLIDYLIIYFKWSNSNGNRTILITKNFKNYWEYMVENYLNSNLYDVENSGGLIFKKDSNKYRFKKEKEYIENLEVRESGLSRNFSVEYDHLYIKSDGIAYLFDSKYYKGIRDLDYKQMAYYYILKSSENYINEKVVNGLILPTEDEYHYRVHLDTRDREGLLEELFIVEHYLNVKEVIGSFVGE